MKDAGIPGGRLREAGGSMWGKKEKKKPQPWARTQQKCGTTQSQHGCLPVGQPLLASLQFYKPKLWVFFFLLWFLMCSNYNNLRKQVSKLGISKLLLASTGSSTILESTLKDISAGWGGLLGLLFSASQWPLRDNLRGDLSLGTSLLKNSRSDSCRKWWRQLVSSMGEAEDKTMVTFGNLRSSPCIFFLICFFSELKLKLSRGQCIAPQGLH